MSEIYLIKHKSAIGNIFRTFNKLIQNQFRTKIKTLRSDNAFEYSDKTLKAYVAKDGIHHQTSCVNTPRQIKVTKRKNRHLLEVTGALMDSMKVPKQYRNQIDFLSSGKRE